MVDYLSLHHQCELDRVQIKADTATAKSDAAEAKKHAHSAKRTAWRAVAICGTVVAGIMAVARALT